MGIDGPTGRFATLFTGLTVTALLLAGCGAGSDDSANQSTTTAVRPTVAPAVVSAPPTTIPPPRTYVVASGDTLGAIASMFNVTVEDLAALNGIDNPNLISVGQELDIPNGTTVATTTTLATTTTALTSS